MRAQRMSQPEPAAGQGALAGFVALLASLAAVGLIALAGLGWVAGSLALDPGRWLRGLDAARVWDAAPPIIATAVVDWDDRLAGEARPLGPLDEADIRALVEGLATPAWLRAQAERIIPGLLVAAAAADEGDGSGGFVVSLADLRARLAGPEALAILQARLATWPACTPAQELAVLGPGPPRCRPTSLSPGQVSLVLGALLSTAAASLPAAVDLAVPGPLPGSGILATSGALDTVRALARGWASLPTIVALALGCLLLAALARAPSPRRMSRAVGAPLVAAGVVLAVASVAVDAVLAGLVGAAGSALAGAGGPPELPALATAAGRAMVEDAGSLLRGPAAALAAGGLALLLLPALVPARLDRR